MDGQVAALWRYPVSSLGGERLEACTVDATGLAGDRAWGLADRDNGETAFPESKRRWRPAPQIRASSAGDGLRLDFPDGSSLPAEAVGDALAAHFGFRVVLRPHAAEAAEAATAGPLKPRYERHPIHILTTASLAALQAILPDSAIDVRRFRPNLVLDLPDAEGFAETGWIGRVVAIGDVRIRIVDPCVRCAFTALADGGDQAQRHPSRRAVHGRGAGRDPRRRRGAGAGLADGLVEGRVLSALATTTSEPCRSRHRRQRTEFDR